MRHTTGTVIKTGNSLALVIPSSFVRHLGIRPKDKVKVSLKPETGRISFTFQNVRQLPLV